MQQYILRRLLMTIPVLFGVSVIIFVIMRIAPGDVALMMMTGSSGEAIGDQESVARLREQLGLNRPYHLQYLDFVTGLIQFNPGKSIWSGLPITQELGQRLPITLQLAFMALFVSAFVAVPTGVLSAFYQDTWVDYLFRVVSIAGLAIPVFWLGTLVVMALTNWFRWLPPLGYAPISDPGKNIQQFIWPAVVLGYANAAVISRMTRSAMLEVLRDDYIRTARAKGLRDAAVIVRHALKNAMLPVITLFSIELGHLIGGAVISETIFTLPGLGRYLVDAIFRRDYMVVQTIIVSMAALFVLLNLITDLIYAWLDPRIRYT